MSTETGITKCLTKSERASDTYRMLSGAKSLREFLVVAASVLGDLCDVVISLEEIAELENSPVHDYESLCDWLVEHPIRPDLKEHWRYYWELAAWIFKDYEQLPSLDDWELYLEIVDPLNPEWDSAISDKEQHIRNLITETCFAITRWVKGTPVRTELV
jgi:hypothetical protein